MKTKQFSLIFLVCLSSFAAFAKDPCAVITSAQDILNCAVSHHPDVQISGADLQRDEALKKIARQVPNPEVEASLLSGQPGAPEGIFVGVGLMQTIELGGKRKNRIRQAIATESLARAEVLKSRELTALNTVLSLHRLRQIRSEIVAVSEAITTYQRILNNYRSRPKLSPEQEVSTAVFVLATDETRLKKMLLLQEQTALLKFLHLATGLDEKNIVSRLPRAQGHWPKFYQKQVDQNLNAEISQANANKAVSEAGLKLARSNSWPDFKVGPTFETQTKIAGRDTAAGINVGFALPILSRNKGEIEYARRDHMRNILAHELTQQKNKSERIQQINRYQQAVQSLEEIKSIAAINSGHASLEGFFAGGLIPASLVIETHRQMIELTESRNMQELNALDALWRLYIIDGKFLSQKI